MEAAAPAAAEAAGREELGGCCVREGVRADVERGCASAGCAEAPGLSSALAAEATAGTWAAAGLIRVQVACPPRQGETPVFFLLSRGLGVKAQGIVVLHGFEFKTQQSKPH